MNEQLIIAGGVYNIILIIFHISFWRIFNWPESINSLNWVNKSTIQVLNISITFIFFIFSYISLVHTQELLNTKLGNTLLVLMSALWLFRAAQQALFYRLKHKASLGLFIFFIGGSVIYAIPMIT
jgi:hypothetical protein